MSTQTNKELSVATNIALDLLGFSEEMIKSRAEILKHAASIFTNKYHNLKLWLDFDFMITGSVGDGIAKLGESDMDIIQVFRNCLCLDNAQVERELCIIQAITADSPPGYRQLNPLELDSNIFAMSWFSFTAEYDLSRGQVFLLSTCMRNFLTTSNETFSSYFAYDCTDREFQEQQGPSVPFTLHYRIPLMPYMGMSFEADYVVALPYISSTVLDSWSKRDRYWPPQSVCQDIMEAEAYFVPVGSSCSENQNYEWRISFTNAESMLVSHLNPLLLKIYILFKMVNKYLIKPNCNILSSYMIKNVMFWMSEHIEPSMCYSPERLINLLLHALAFLRSCLHSKFIPNYMIQERNLLLGKGNPRDISRLKCIISNFLDTGGIFVMEIEKVKTRIFADKRCFRDAKRLSEIRDAFEIMFARMTLYSLSEMSVYKPSLAYDLIFELYKNPLFIDLIFKLMNLLKLDIVSCIANPEQFLKVINDFMLS